MLESGYVNSTYPDLATLVTTHVNNLAASGPNNANLVTTINDIGGQLPTSVTTLSANGNMTNANGFVIYSTLVTAGTPADYAIYAKTSTGYFCIASDGSTKTNTGAIPTPTAWNTCQ
jgi:hypothetical protein